MTIKQRYEAVIAYFTQHAPNAETELVYNNPFELLVCVILSAQCTDKRINAVSPILFKQFPTATKMALATFDEVFGIIKSISYPNNKSKHLIGMAIMLVNNYNTEVPNTVEELIKLPGVGRKTANVITSVLFNQPNMAVDTHVFRVSARIGLTNRAKTPLQTELQLIKNIPEALVHVAHHWLILHGRYVCVARSPKCAECGISNYCKFYSRKATAKTVA
jgi:endonuclease III